MSPREQVAALDAQTAVDAARFAKEKAQAAAAAAAAVQPDPRTTIVGELAALEATSLLRRAPRRNKWRELEAFEEKLVAIEAKRNLLAEHIQELNLQLHNEPARHSQELGEWLAAGEKGKRPEPRKDEIETELDQTQAEHEALAHVHAKLLHERVEHVARHRKRLAADIEKEIEQKRVAALEQIDQLERDRQELLDLAATKTWVLLFPHETLAAQPNTQALVGARKAVQRKHLPGVEMGLQAAGVFELLREDVGFAATVSTVDQAAAVAGVTAKALTGGEAAWGGSAEALEQERRDKQRVIDDYTREFGAPPPRFS